jgi:glutaredoxin
MSRSSCRSVLGWCRFSGVMQTQGARMKKSLLLSFAWLVVACGNPAPGSQPASASPLAAAPTRGELVKPPFAVEGEAEGLLLVWYDEQGGAHPASSRSEVPEGQRANVRVDALELAPDQRLDPAFVYVADLRAPGAGGQYPVRKQERAAFETSLASAAPAAGATAAAKSGSSDVIIYGASWCGACKQAARFFSQKGVAFVEKDIEKEPGARSEMMAKARAQGVQTGGIPVIDVKGTLLGGFNAQRIEQLLASN